jgi:uncharacterized protein (TIGR02246 family)
MRVFCAVFSFILLIFLPVSCQRVEKERDQSMVNVDDDVQAIKSLINEWYEAYYVRDVDRLLSFYTEDAMRIGDNAPTLVGKEAIGAAFRQEMAQYDMQDEDDSEIDDKVEDVHVSGDLGAARGVDITITPKEGGASSKSIVRWVTIYERQADGTRRIMWEIWNKFDQSFPSSEKL